MVFSGGLEKRLWLCGVLIGAAAMLAHAEDAEVLTIRTEARAEGTGFTAKTKAIARAQENAIGQLLGRMAPQVDPQLMEPIFREAARYVDSYDLLRQDTLDDATKVEIDAHIAARPLQQDLAGIVLPRLPEKPTVVLLLGEQLVGDKIVAVPDEGTAEVALRTGMRKLGLNVNSSSELSQAYQQSDLIEILAGGVAGGARFAQENLCDAAIVGTGVCVLEPNAFGTNVSRGHGHDRARRRGQGPRTPHDPLPRAAIPGRNAARGAPGRRSYHRYQHALLLPQDVSTFHAVRRPHVVPHQPDFPERLRRKDS